MKTLRRLALRCALTGALAACGDEKSSGEAEKDGVRAAPDGGVTQPAAGSPIPLILWVDDLIDHHTTEESPPDTVHDKNIADDEDPRHFLKYFPK